jgi:hypothetical protein
LALLLRGMSLVPPDDAAGGSAQDAMVAGVMAGNPTDQRALDASLGVRHGRCHEHDDCQGRYAKAMAVPIFFMRRSGCISENEDVAALFPRIDSGAAN